MKQNARRIVRLFIFVSLLSGKVIAGELDQIALAGLGQNVKVFFDNHSIPHIYAKSWPDAARVLGYLHAGERLIQMDLFRRQGSGTVAEILGEEALPSDIIVRQLGIRRGCEAVWSSDSVPAQLRAELIAYAEGVNARIAELGDKGLPASFQKLGYKPLPWTPVDTLVFSKYMGWDQSGTLDDLWFGLMVEKLGVAAFEELWPIDRPYEISTVKIQSDRRKYISTLVPVSGAGTSYGSALRHYAGLRWLGRGGSFGSNNWAVDGTRTASGKPMLCNDPHLGFNLPMIWYACHISVNGENLVGVTFPGGPGMVIGHNDDMGWGFTNLQADAVDMFVETLSATDSMQYQHRGEWKKISRITEKIAVRGGSARELQIDSTVHGPIISREGGKTISLCWTGLGPTKDFVAVWRISHAKNLKDFLGALDDLTVPAMNVIYADRTGNIAIHPCGSLPLRLRGQGRIPMDGASGDNDWTGMIPRDELPLSVNPPDHFVASANGRPTPLGYPHYLGWMWDCNYRTRRINEMLGSARKLTVETIKVIQLDHYDKAAERFLPILLQDLKTAPLGDPLSKKAVRELQNWNFIASTDSLAPAIWLRWFDLYRGRVWDDEWKSRGIEQPAGSWGFSGSNHREPEIEVLEYLTREFPSSIWFNDCNTPERETRTDISRRSFEMAIASLKKEFSSDIDHWRWGNINQLKIDSLTHQPDLDRNAGGTVGTDFTVNPGSNVGTVGAGASWRMIVDFGHLDRSVGIYPGGQSGDPRSTFYDDQMKLWAKGQYVPLHMVSDPGKLPAAARTKVMAFHRP